MKKTSFAIATLLGIGFFPFAPGTVGSLVSVMLCIPIIYYLGLYCLIFITIILFIVGLIATKRVLLHTPHDPGFVVIDETVGQWITFFFVVPLLETTPFVGSTMATSTWWIYSYGFLAFRFFDILKPHPIKFLDQKIKNSFGVMIDDVLAGLYASATIFIITQLAL